MKRFMAVVAVVLCLSGPARAADDIVIGAIYPLTGNAAQIGADARAAIDTMLEIVNGTHDKLPMLMGKGGGLDHLGGARIRVVYADHQNDPQKARAEAERLVTQDKVVALIGSYTSATAATISQVAERYEVPYLSMDNSSPSLHKRGLKWFFRTSPHDEMFTQAMFDFFKEVGAKTGRPVKFVALFYEDSIFGSDSSTVQRKLAADGKIAVAADIKYRANSPSLSAEAQRLKAANADVLMPSSYTSDAILLMRSLSELGYKPAAVMALFRARANKDLNDNTSRQVVAVQVLADAINRSGSAKPDDIRKALMATNVPGDQTIMPWKGVRFDETGQNQDATPVIQQVVNGAFRTVFPAAVAVQDPTWNVGK